MKKPPLIVEFPVVSITNTVLGLGLGVAMAWSMTAHIDRQYQSTMIELGAIAGAVIGLVVGDLAYYAILRRQVSFEGVSIIVTTTGTLGSVAAYLLHAATNTGGWMSVFVAVSAALVCSFKLRR